MEYSLAATETVAVASSSADINTGSTSPRSRRVARPSLSSVTVPPLTTSTSFSPPLPARSPLRPQARSISSQSSGTVSHLLVTSSNTSVLTLDSPELPQTPTDDLAAFPDAALPPTFQMRDRHNSYPSLNGLVDPLTEAEGSRTSLGIDSKSLPERPESPLSLNDLEAESIDATHSSSASPSSSAAASVAQQPTMTKRQHALHELLSSERAYTSDLVLIKEVHIPLASGLTAPLHNLPITPPNSSGSSTRTVSTASDSSAASLGPPMTPEDVKIIFSNIEELAELADQLTEELESALGSAVEGGQGDDFIGALFIKKVIPRLERPYKQYITRHPTALQHLQNLPQTPELTKYLSYTQTVASSVSHAWDLASLLIKPVQRLLKYPLLLAAILDETPDSHPDKDNLRKAREGVEELARNVNEGRRRAEVIKDVLTSKTPKKPNAPVGVAASVNLSKVKSLRHGGVTAATMRVSQLTDGNSEAALVEALQNELKRLDVFAQQFAKNVVDWGKMMSNVMLGLRTWALSFGKVIGLSSQHSSEAFEAFVEVVKRGLMPLTSDLEAVVNERLLKDIALLLGTMNQPLKLLASMNEQEPYHYHLLTMPLSQKNRPPPSLLAASQNYLALRGQLAAELPVYIDLLHRSFAILIRRLAAIQTRFWRDVKEHWAELWEMLRVEGEMNAGFEETCMVWSARWADADELVMALNIMQPVPHLQPTPKVYPQQNIATHEQYFSYPGFYMPLTPGFMVPPPPTPQPREKERETNKLEKHNSKSSSGSKPVANVAAVQSMIAALEPSHSPVHKKSGPNASLTVNMLTSLNPAGMASTTYTPSFVSGSSFGAYSVSAPMPLGSVQPMGKEGKRGRGVSDASTLASGSSGRRPSSQDSVHSRQQKDASKVPRRRTHGHLLADEFAEYMVMNGGAMPPSYDGVQHTHSPGGVNPSTSLLRQGLPRMKSMPLSKTNSDRTSLTTNTTSRTAGGGSVLPLANGVGYVVEGDCVYYQSPPEEVWEEYQPYQDFQQPETTRQMERGRDRTRPTNRRSQTQTAPAPPNPSDSSPKRKSKERPTHARKRSGSVKSITSFFTGGGHSSSANSSTAPPDPPPLTASQRDSWVSKPAKYICQVVHPCKPPASVSYYSFPFFTLLDGELYEVLQEAGHPSMHPDLPLYVDEGADCLLLVRDGNGVVGWALASFMEPVSIGG